MTHKICFIIFFISISLSASSQDVRFRNFNTVAFEIVTPPSEDEINDKIPVDSLHKEIDFFVKTIEELGVNPYINIPKDDFNKSIDLLKRKIDVPLTRREFLLQFVPVVNELKLSHTRLYTPVEIMEEKKVYDRNQGKYLPIEVEINNNQLIITEDYSENDLPIGKEILSINNIQTKTIIDSLYKYSKGATKFSKINNTQNRFATLFWWVYNISRPFNIELTDSIYTIKGKTKKELKAIKKKNKFTTKEKEPYVQYEYISVNSNTRMLRFRDFGIRDESKYYNFLDSVFLTLNKDDIKNLIIDVRNNPGGGDNYGIEVIKYLYNQPFHAYSKFYYKKSKRLENFQYMFLYPEDRDNPKMREAANCMGDCHELYDYGEYYECDKEMHNPKPDSIRFKGKVYVLANHRVYSAGNTFVGLIKDYEIGKIVGTETGQSPSNDGQLCMFYLPRSKILAGGSTTLCIRPNGDPQTSTGVLPDYEVHDSKEEKQKRVDTVMEYTMNLIKN